MSNEFAVFESMLLSELDRYFNAEIACCDHCCDDFLESWPWADKADDYDFQRRSIDLQWFYDTGRMRDVWTEAEYWALMGRWNVLDVAHLSPGTSGRTSSRLMSQETSSLRYLGFRSLQIKHHFCF